MQKGKTMLKFFINTLLPLNLGKLPHICSGNFIYKTKTKQWFYSYIQTSNIVKNNIYKYMTFKFIETTASFSESLLTIKVLIRTVSGIFLYVLTNNEKNRKYSLQPQQLFQQF